MSNKYSVSHIEDETVRKIEDCRVIMPTLKQSIGITQVEPEWIVEEDDLPDIIKKISDLELPIKEFKQKVRDNSKMWQNYQVSKLEQPEIVNDEIETSPQFFCQSQFRKTEHTASMNTIASNLQQVPITQSQTHRHHRQYESVHTNHRHHSSRKYSTNLNNAFISQVSVITSKSKSPAGILKTTKSHNPNQFVVVQCQKHVHFGKSHRCYY